jgi:hypothetical protein
MANHEKETSMKRPEHQLAALFEGLTRIERFELLGRLEQAGASIYRALGAGETNLKARDALLTAACDEEKNGNLLRLMSNAKDSCERCGQSLSLTEGVACTFQCTFCDSCGQTLNRVCPNCEGMLVARPAQRAQLQLRHSNQLGVGIAKLVYWLALADTARNEQYWQRRRISMAACGARPVGGHALRLRDVLLQ